MVQGDISSLRVLLLLADADGNKYLQAAVWDADSATYAITRSSNLPENAYLDTYHEGDAIFLSVGYDTPGFAESGDLDDLAWLYITAEWTDTDAWVVTGSRSSWITTTGSTSSGTIGTRTCCKRFRGMQHWTHSTL